MDLQMLIYLKKGLIREGSLLTWWLRTHPSPPQLYASGTVWACWRGIMPWFSSQPPLLETGD